MLPLPELSLLRPTRVEEALEALSEPGARVLAGGTDLLPALKQGLAAERRLVAVSRLQELQGLGWQEDTLVVGAGVSLRRLGDAVRDSHPALFAATRTVATSTLQRMATLGGNLLLDSRCRWFNQPAFWREAKGPCLKCDPEGPCYVALKGRGCYAAHSADTVPVLMLLGASVELASVRGRRRLPIEALYGEDGRRTPCIDPDELLLSVHIPRQGGPLAYRKLRARGAVDFPLLLVAVTRQRAVISAVGPRPLVFDIAGLSDEEAVERVHAGVFPLDTHLAPHTWRRRMVKVELRRALAAL